MKLGKQILVATLLLIAGCAKNQAAEPTDPALGPGKVATVDGTAIPESVFRLYVMSTLRKSADDLTPEERKQVIDDLVGVEVLVAEAAKRGIPKERTIAAQLELQRMQVMARAMATRYIEENPPTEEELKAVYDQNLPRLSAQQYKAHHILVETKEEADAVISQLNKGKEFAALAKERANGPTGANGGDLGWFTADSMVPEVIAAVKQLKVGSYTKEPVKSQYGYHVILLDDTRAGTPPTLDSVRKDLANVVDRNKLEGYVSSLRKSAKVTTE